MKHADASKSALLCLDARRRADALRALQEREFDLIVIGGGITGAGIALDAASRGMRVALVEKSDFAAGTSSKSTKLIHGGLRYLKNLEFALVREVGRERAVVHALAPHLVVPEKMLLPIVRGGTFGWWATWFGLWVYDHLAGVRGEDRRIMLDRTRTLEEEPNLRPEGLRGAGLYAEYRTDDARLTIEVIKTAARQGALCLNYLSAEGFCYEGGRVCGVQVRDELQGQAFELRSRYVVSAAGPWVDRLRKLDHSLRGKHLFHSKGVHLAVPHQRLPLRHAVYFDVPDGRMLFAIPRERVTYLGTTDTPYHGSLECVEATLEDAEYILRGVNHIFPDARLRLEDVESSWAGLRPLIFEEGKKPSEMSRRDEIFESPSGLLSIAGGKLTGYRLMAKKVVDRIARRYRRAFRRRFEPCRTHRIPLHPQPFADYPAAQAFAQTLHPRLQSLELDTSWATYLVHRYGPDAAEILRRCEAANLRGETGLIQGEVRYGVEREGVCTALDFYERRSGRLFFHLPSIAPTRGVVLEELAACLGWNEERLRREATRLDEAVERATTFLPEAAQRPA